MSRRTLVLVGVLACIVAIGLAANRWTPTPGVTLANFKRLNGGMKINEIEEILGPSHENGFLKHEWTGEEGTVHLNAISVVTGRTETSTSFEIIGWQGSFTRTDGMGFLLAHQNDSFFARIRRWLFRNSN